MEKNNSVLIKDFFSENSRPVTYMELKELTSNERIELADLIRSTA